MSVLSVQVPVYNAEKYLEDCLISILAELPPDGELLICDDCSTDASFTVAERFAAVDSRIRLEINSANLGEAGTRRRMMGMSEADYIMPIDADDLLLPGRIKRQLGLLDAVPELSAVYGKAFYFEHEKSSCGYYLGRTFSNFLIFGGNPLGHGSVMFRRAAALAAGGYREPSDVDGKSLVSCDYFLWRRLALTGGMHFDNSFVYAYRMHGAQAVQTRAAEFGKAHERMNREFKETHASCLDSILNGGQPQASAVELMQCLGFLVCAFKGMKRDYLGLTIMAEEIDSHDHGPPTVRFEYLLDKEDYEGALELGRDIRERWDDDVFVSMCADKMMLTALKKAGRTPSVDLLKDYEKQQTGIFGSPDECQRLMAVINRISAKPRI